MTRKKVRHLVYDIFPFSGEEILDLRLKLLFDHVDFFIIGEAEIDFDGNKKTLKFDKNLYNWALSKIRYLEFDEADFAGCIDEWDRERRMRNLLKAGLYDASSDDCILISDCDELFDPRKLQEPLENSVHIYSFGNFRFYGNYMNVSVPVWRKAVSCRYELLNSLDIYDLYRAHINKLAFFDSFGNAWIGKKNEFKLIEVTNSGWHFSYLGGQKTIIQKVKNFGPDFVPKSNRPDIYRTRQLERRILFGFDIFNKPELWGRVGNYSFGYELVETWFKSKGFLSRRPTPYYGDAKNLMVKYLQSSETKKNIKAFPIRIIFRLLRTLNIL